MKTTVLPPIHKNQGTYTTTDPRVYSYADPQKWTIFHPGEAAVEQTPPSSSASSVSSGNSGGATGPAPRKPPHRLPDAQKVPRKSTSSHTSATTKPPFVVPTVQGMIPKEDPKYYEEPAMVQTAEVQKQKKPKKQAAGAYYQNYQPAPPGYQPNPPRQQNARLPYKQAAVQQAVYVGAAPQDQYIPGPAASQPYMEPAAHVPRPPAHSKRDQSGNVELQQFPWVAEPLFVPHNAAADYEQFSNSYPSAGAGGAPNYGQPPMGNSTYGPAAATLYNKTMPQQQNHPQQQFQPVGSYGNPITDQYTDFESYPSNINNYVDGLLGNGSNEQGLYSPEIASSQPAYAQPPNDNVIQDTQQLYDPTATYESTTGVASGPPTMKDNEFIPYQPLNEGDEMRKEDVSMSDDEGKRSRGSSWGRSKPRESKHEETQPSSLPPSSSGLSTLQALFDSNDQPRAGLEALRASCGYIPYSPKQSSSNSNPTSRSSTRKNKDEVADNQGIAEPGRAFVPIIEQQDVNFAAPPPSHPPPPPKQQQQASPVYVPSPAYSAPPTFRAPPPEMAGGISPRQQVRVVSPHTYSADEWAKRQARLSADLDSLLEQPKSPDKSKDVSGIRQSKWMRELPPFEEEERPIPAPVYYEVPPPQHQPPPPPLPQHIKTYGYYQMTPPPQEEEDDELEELLDDLFRAEGDERGDIRKEEKQERLGFTQQERMDKNTLEEMEEEDRAREAAERREEEDEKILTAQKAQSAERREEDDIVAAVAPVEQPEAVRAAPPPQRDQHSLEDLLNLLQDEEQFQRQAISTTADDMKFTLSALTLENLEAYERKCIELEEAEARQELNKEHEKLQEEWSAMKIQAAFRGLQGRKEANEMKQKKKARAVVDRPAQAVTAAPPAPFKQPKRENEGMLQVTVVKGVHIIDSPMNTCKVDVKINKQAGNTSWQTGTVNPYWNETFEYQVQLEPYFASRISRQYMFVEVFSNDSAAGKAKVPLDRLKKNIPQDVVVTLPKQGQLLVTLVATDFGLREDDPYMALTRQRLLQYNEVMDKEREHRCQLLEHQELDQRQILQRDLLRALQTNILQTEKSLFTSSYNQYQNQLALNGLHDLYIALTDLYTTQEWVERQSLYNLLDQAMTRSPYDPAPPPPVQHTRAVAAQRQPANSNLQNQTLYEALTIVLRYRNLIAIEEEIERLVLEEVLLRGHIYISEWYMFKYIVMLEETEFTKIHVRKIENAWARYLFKQVPIRERIAAQVEYEKNLKAQPPGPVYRPAPTHNHPDWQSAFRNLQQQQINTPTSRMDFTNLPIAGHPSQYIPYPQVSSSSQPPIQYINGQPSLTGAQQQQPYYGNTNASPYQQQQPQGAGLNFAEFSRPPVYVAQPPSSQSQPQPPSYTQQPSYTSAPPPGHRNVPPNAKAWIGIDVAMMNDALGHKNTVAMIRGVQPNSPADNAGLAVGDVLVEWSGIKVTEVSTLDALFRASKPGVIVPLTIIRKGIKLQITLIVGAQQTPGPASM